MKILIVDDEAPARGLLKIFLKDHVDCEVVGEAADGMEGYRLYQELQPDLVFLDIQMPKVNGFEMLELLENPPCVVFATAYDQYALKAFEKNAIDYLLKPFGKERLAQTLERVRERLKLKASSTVSESPERNLVKSEGLGPNVLERIPVKLRGKIHIVPVRDIFLAEAEGDYVMLSTLDGRYLKEITMKYLESHLPTDQFCRVHRSAIVRIDAVKGVEPVGSDAWQVRLKNDATVRASAEGLKSLKKRLGL